MDLNRDFAEMLSELSAAKARFLVVGAYAVAHHGEPRYTKDLDLWVDATPENAKRVWSALARFGAPLSSTRPEDFENPTVVYQIGLEPNRIDILTGIEGCSFDSAWKARVRARIGGVDVPVIGLDDLIRAKRAAGRPQDLLDLERLLPRRRARRRRGGR